MVDHCLIMVTMHQVNVSSANSSFKDFFTNVDDRPVRPFQPIYTAAWLEDKFKYKDLIIRVGVRADRYDANTMVPKDPYVLAGHYTVADFKNNVNGADDYAIVTSGDFNNILPGNMGDDYVVYMKGAGADANVAGYRQGDQWYNASGLAVDNPNTLGALIQPALKGVDQVDQISLQGSNFNPDEVFEQYNQRLY